MTTVYPFKMQRFIDAFTAGTAHFQLLLGFVVAFVTAVLRTSMKQRRSSIGMRLCEGLLCSFLATACTQAVVLMFGLSYDYAMPIAVLISFLGTEFISSILIGVIKYKTFGKHDDHEKS